MRNNGGFRQTQYTRREKDLKRRIEERRKQDQLREELEYKSICFTGHRPNKLGNCYSLTNNQSKYIHSKLEPILIDLIKDEGVEQFISGGAIGFDQIAFWTVRGLKKTYYPNIKILLLYHLRIRLSSGMTVKLKYGIRKC